MSAPLSIAVIIPTYRREEHLRLCLGDVFSQNRPPDSIVIVDQTPEHEPATHHLLENPPRLIQWIRHSIPNLPGARNIGIRHCRSDIVLFLDDDARVGPDFVGNHLKNYEESDVMGVAGPVLETMDSWVDTLPAHAMDPFEQRFNACWQYRHRRPVLHAPGGNMSFRRSLISEVGDFDDRYQGPAFREETDFFLRVSSKGHAIIYDPDCWILHHNGPKPGGCWDEAWKRQIRLRAFNEAYFAVKNFPTRNWFYFLWKSIRAAALSRTTLREPARIPLRLVSVFSAWIRALREAERRPIKPC